MKTIATVSQKEVGQRRACLRSCVLLKKRARSASAHASRSSLCLPLYGMQKREHGNLLANG